MWTSRLGKELTLLCVGRCVPALQLLIFLSGRVSNSKRCRKRKGLWFLMRECILIRLRNALRGRKKRYSRGNRMFLEKISGKLFGLWRKNWNAVVYVMHSCFGLLRK